MTVFTNIGSLATMTGSAPGLAPRRHAAFAVEQGRIAWVGRAVDAPDAGRVFDLGGRTVLPGLVDVSADPTVEPELMTARFAEAARCGTTLLTASGHDADSLRTAGRLTDEVVLSVRLTGLGDAAVDRWIEQTLPGCASRARWADIDADSPRLTADQVGRLAAAIRAVGLRPRLLTGRHMLDELAQHAPSAGIDAVLHLAHAGDAQLVTLGAAGTRVALLPGVSLVDGGTFADARTLWDAGASLSLGSGSPSANPSPSLAHVATLAAFGGGLTPAEALWAATAGGAQHLGRGELGGLGVGFRADFLVLDSDDPFALVTRPGVDLIAAVYQRGSRIHARQWRR